MHNQIPRNANNYAALVIPTSNASKNQLSNSSRGTLPNFSDIPTSSGSKDALEIDLKELKFEKQIGAGGFGVVYRGTWRGGAVAIKQVIDKFNSSDIENFKAEAKLMASLR
jgi:hypothetical protein